MILKFKSILIQDQSLITKLSLEQVMKVNKKQVTDPKELINIESISQSQKLIVPGKVF